MRLEVGKRYGRLLILSEESPEIKQGRSRKRKRDMVAVRCDCGTVKVLRAEAIQFGWTKSCGCLSHEKKPNGHKTYPEYSTWKNMKDRCLNPNSSSYMNYGGRGITICDQWLHGFPSFLNDMGRRPTPQHTIERINNDGNYEPDNCKWETRINQNRNRRSTILSIDIAREVRRLRESGMMPSEISQLLSVSYHAVGAIIYSNKWREAA